MMIDLPIKNQIELQLYGETEHDGKVYVLPPDNRPIYGVSVIDTIESKNTEGKYKVEKVDTN